MENSNLFEHIDVNELIYETSVLAMFEISNKTLQKTSLDDAAFMVAHSGNFFASAKIPKEMQFKPPKEGYKLWESIKSEFIILVCTKDKKYAELRRKIKALDSTPVHTLVSFAIARQIGVEPLLIAPFCAVCIYFAAKFPKEVFCNMVNKNTEK